MLYVLWGEDDFSLRQSLEEIKRGIGDQTILAANTTTLDGQHMTLDQLRAGGETVPFLAERRLVIVRGLLGRFESRSKSGRQGKTRHVTDQQSEYKSLGDYISKLPESTILVLIEGRISNKNPLLMELSNQAEVKSFPLLRGTRLHQWIQGRVTEEGGSIFPQAVDLLARLVGGNLWIMTSEINRLVLFTSGRRIEEKDIGVVVGYAQQVNVFAMVDAILEFKVGVAEQSLQQLLQRGATPAYLLVMLSRQVRMIVRARELRNRGTSAVEIQHRLGLTSDFALAKTLGQADKYHLEQLKEVYHQLLEVDLSVKTGKYDGELALNILIAELCQRRGWTN